MTCKSFAAISLFVVATGLVACSNPDTHAPAAPSRPSGPLLNSSAASVVFTDPRTGVSTSDVRDARGHVVQFTTGGDLVWIDGTTLSGHQVGGPGHPFYGNV